MLFKLLLSNISPLIQKVQNYRYTRRGNELYDINNPVVRREFYNVYGLTTQLLNMFSGQIYLKEISIFKLSGVPEFRLVLSDVTPESRTNYIELVWLKFGNGVKSLLQDVTPRRYIKLLAQDP